MAKKRKTVVKASQPEEQLDSSSPPVEEEKATATNAPQAPISKLSPLTIALQKERGVYNKRKTHCPPQNQRWSDQYNGPRST